MKSATSTAALESGGVFAPTRWSLVLRARAGGSPLEREALNDLCRAYWPPLYAFLRRRGFSAQDAQDRIQGFFLHVLEADTLTRVHQGRGRFRTFLLAALNYFLLNEWGKQRAIKRGGAHQFVSWDELAAVEAEVGEPVDGSTMEEFLDRRWAWTLVGHTLKKLGQEYAASGKRAVFDALQPRLTGETQPGADAAAAARLDMTEGAVKTALSRLRKRFGELLRAEIAETVERPEDVDDEIRHLFRALGR